VARDDHLQGRLVELAEQLLRKTLAGDISWSETDKPMDFLYSGPNSSVSIYRVPQLAISGQYILTVFNWRGTELGVLRSGYVTKEDTRMEAEWNETLSNLYEEARKNALNIDKVLDTLLTDLSEEHEAKPADEETENS
jgi:hypothetical protein